MRVWEDVAIQAQGLHLMDHQIEKQETISTEQLLSESLDWDIGKVLLSGYIIKGILGTGGMGKVYLVAPYKFEGQPLAMKTLLNTSIIDRAQQRLFMNELQTWIDLPEHPYITSFRFFRTIENRMALFSEYINGGSLDRWIKDKQLMTLDRILDVAIQLAWGLNAAHDHGVIHQDVKPANVLLTREGIVKITDFGLSNACHTSGIKIEAPDESNMHLVSCRGMTLAYSSPEQTASEKLTFKTDIWSYGLLILQMFTGGITWKFGLMAPALLDEYSKTRMNPPYPEIPAPVEAVLRECFRADPKERWTSMDAIATRLIEIYREETGVDYPRHPPGQKKQPGRVFSPHDHVTAPGIWNDPRPFLKKILAEIGLDEKPFLPIMSSRGASHKAQALRDLQLFDEILLLAQSYPELKSQNQVNASLLREKALVHGYLGDQPGELDILETVIGMIDKWTTMDGRHDMDSDLGRVYMQKAGALFVLRHFQEAIEMCDLSICLFERLICQEERVDLEADLARVYTKKAGSLGALGRHLDAVGFFDQAIAIQARLSDTEGRCELKPELAFSFLNKAISLDALNYQVRAIETLDQAITLFNRLVYQEGKHDLKHDLARSYMSKSNLLHAQGRNQESLELNDLSSSIIDGLMQEESRLDLESDLAKVFMNTAVVHWALGRFQDAIEMYDRSIAIRERLLNNEGRFEMEPDLAKAYMNKANSMVSLGRFDEALPLFDRSIAIRERLIRQDGRRELEPGLSVVYQNKAATMELLMRYDDAIEMYNLAVEILERLINQDGRREMESLLARVFMNKANSLTALHHRHEAIETYNKSIVIGERLSTQEGRRKSDPGLAMAYMNKSFALMGLDRLSDALEMCDRSIAIRMRLIEQEGRRELLGDLAWIQIHRVELLDKLNQIELAKSEIGDALKLLRSEYERTGRDDLRKALVAAEKGLLHLIEAD